MSGNDAWLAEVGTALARAAVVGADPAQYLIRHGSMRVGVYVPQVDDQAPHRQDELYIVHRGRALLERGEETCPVAGGHVAFVPAGMPHRFLEPSADFATWVVFWGPDGGDATGR